MLFRSMVPVGNLDSSLIRAEGALTRARFSFRYALNMSHGDKAICLGVAIVGAIAMGVDMWCERSWNVEACIGMLMFGFGISVFCTRRAGIA